jgi:ubiquinone/menaquinone biosynthesis C-methylase UbiE
MNRKRVRISALYESLSGSTKSLLTLAAVTLYGTSAAFFPLEISGFTFLLILVFFTKDYLLTPFLRGREIKADTLLFSEGRHKDSSEKLLREELSIIGLNHRLYNFNEKLTLADIIRTQIKQSKNSDQKTKLEIGDKIRKCRQIVFSKKYTALNQNDEKVFLFDERGDWSIFFNSHCKKFDIQLHEKMNAVDVGFGNGEAFRKSQYFPIFHDFVATDLSETALNVARTSDKKLTTVVCDGENLEIFSNNQFDIYFSFRTYQSSFFNRRLAIHEAWRVLKEGGVIFITLPKLYVTVNRQILEGLSRQHGRPPEKRYLIELSEDIEQYLEMLNFVRIRIDNFSSPYELIISGFKS